MKTFNDEEFQKMLDSNDLQVDHELSADEESDLKAYKLLFNELKKEPEVSLPYDFSGKVIARLKDKKKSESDLQIYILSAALLAVSIFSIYFAASYFNQSFSAGFLNIIWKYKWILSFALFVLAVIQYLDQKIVKRLF